MARILSIDSKTHSLVERNHALAMAGYSVQSPRTPEEAPALLAQSDFHAVVIAHSVTPEQRKRTIPALRKVNPAIPIIFVYASTEPEVEPQADICIDVADDPVELVKFLRNLLIAI